MSNTFIKILTPFWASISLGGIIFLIIFPSCTQTKQNKTRAEMVEIKDMNGRLVHIPKQINKIIAHRSGALRMICYLNATQKVIGIEANERRRSVPYLYAYPELRKLPLIGSGNSADPELITALQPDIIFCTYFSSSEADELQKKTGIPVVCLNYGDFNDHKKEFYASLKLLGKLINKEKRADSLITFMETNLEEIKLKCSQSFNKERVYIGGIAYRGAHGINSTEPKYAPFRYTNCINPAEELIQNSKSGFSKLTTVLIDKEEIIKWNPDKIFIDISGYKLSKKDLDKNSTFGKLIPAIKKGEVYTLLPHIWNTINYEHILINTYYIASILKPEQFPDFNIKETANQVYQQFLNKAIYDEMVNLYGMGYGKLNYE